ncbi:hypothetical protein AT00_19335 [Pseudoalteromonas lipolytica SCSIO 04301]|uniref:hypothetical protein n=1 Tax=Pseudoalteromonas TaxID=53246 RepID=UPI000446F01B|nr:MULTISPECIES: hypothetical protein [Pseudoalteromonas]EWH04432.1 hypothetical protein AT00_19335 [Pseudoalteromonas lipolytica SCSIO 04301]MCC9662676.1 hypothetical protein [Pseudoalteromonas sp. MB41]MCF2922827.1 hypothetical protein [Pseudoalteromonas sp. APAL1]|tara:strand:- start:94 stop:372 length:279 start_codon:yes stop_codon:yes gene_type:complete
MLDKVLAQVKTDNSGLLIEVPVLLSEYGVFDPLLDYVISQSHIKILPWVNRITFALHLWLDDVFYDPENLSGVIVRLYHPEDIGYSFCSQVS